MVETPVGMKCRAHGLAATPRHYQVSPLGYALAIPVGFVLAAIGGAIALYIPFFFLAAIFLGVLSGRLIGDAISFCTGWKRGPRLAAIAAATIGLGAVSAPVFILVGSGRLILLGDLWGALLALELRPLLFGSLAAVTAFWRIR